MMGKEELEKAFPKVGEVSIDPNAPVTGNPVPTQFLGDLTFRELAALCKSHRHCEGCPLYRERSYDLCDARLATEDDMMRRVVKIEKEAKE